MSEPSLDFSYTLLLHNKKKYNENISNGRYSDTDIVRLLTNCKCKHLINADSVTELSNTLFKANELLNRIQDESNGKIVLLFEEYVNKKLTEEEEKSVDCIEIKTGETLYTT